MLDSQRENDDENEDTTAVKESVSGCSYKIECKDQRELLLYQIWSALSIDDSQFSNQYFKTVM